MKYEIIYAENMKQTQHERIYELVKDGSWVCQHEFWAVSHSPHKRRGEMSSIHPEYIKSTCEKFAIHHWLDRKCEHDIDGARDYRAITHQMKAVMESIASVPVFAAKETKKEPQSPLFP